MHLELRIRGTKDDVNAFVDKMKSSIPDNVLCISRYYPQTRYDKDSKEVACYVKLSDKGWYMIIVSFLIGLYLVAKILNNNII